MLSDIIKSPSFWIGSTFNGIFINDPYFNSPSISKYENGVEMFNLHENSFYDLGLGGVISVRMSGIWIKLDSNCHMIFLDFFRFIINVFSKDIKYSRQMVNKQIPFIDIFPSKLVYSDSKTNHITTWQFK